MSIVQGFMYPNTLTPHNPYVKFEYYNYSPRDEGKKFKKKLKLLTYRKRKIGKYQKYSKN